MLRQGLFICLILLSIPTYAQSILVVESYHSQHPWSISYRKGLMEVLQDNSRLHFVEMDTKRLPKSLHPQQAERAWQQYLKLTPDLVIIADDNALQALAPRLLNTNTPVVYFGINANPRKYNITHAANFYGVLERPLLKRSISMLKSFIDVKKALILFDDSETSNVVINDVFYGNTTINIAGIQVDIKQHSQYSQWQQSVLQSKQQEYDAMIVALYQTLKDENNKHVDAEQVMHWTSSHTLIPPFAFWEFSIGNHQNIGGYVISGYQEAKLAGQIALELLNNSQPKVKHQTGHHGQFVFSKRQLRKWDITLPPTIKQQSQFVE